MVTTPWSSTDTVGAALSASIPVVIQSVSSPWFLVPPCMAVTEFKPLHSALRTTSLPSAERSLVVLSTVVLVTIHWSSPQDANGTSLSGGAGADTISGAISVGSSGVSFWGGAGNDTFELRFQEVVSPVVLVEPPTSGTNLVLTASFCRTASPALQILACFFGVTSGASMDISVRCCCSRYTTAFRCWNNVQHLDCSQQCR